MVVAYIDNMESKIINIYFDQNAYPFKDKERSVIYPITGSAFVGFNATQKIRFFVDRIGGVLDTTWVATTKLPNGQLIYELLQNTNYDSEIGEYYVELTLTQPYSALKGDISIGLSGYQGGVEVQEDEDTGIYTIVGTPTIQTSAVIKFNINYTPSTLPKQTLGFTDLQQVLAYMSNFMQQDESIVVIENTSVDLSGFEDGQVFYCKLDQLFYRLDSGNLVVEKDGYVPYTGATKNVDLGNHTITALRFISGDVSETTYRERNLLYITHGAYSNTYIFRVKNANTNDYVATEDYVDNNIYEMASASVVLSDSDYAYLLKNNVRIHYGDLFYEKAKETESQVVFYSVDYQRTTTGGSTGYTTRTTKKITLTKSSQQLDAADINDLSYNKEQTDNCIANYAYSKAQVDDLITQFKENELQVVSSLPTTGEEGIIYLLPIDPQDLSQGYYRYIWENNAWLNLGTTEIDLSNYYTKGEVDSELNLKADKSTTYTKTETDALLNAKANDNAVVHNTGNETIAGNKTFTGSTSFKYEINFTSPDGTKSGAFRLADNGNFIWRVGNLSKLMYDYANGNFSSWVDIVSNGDNAQSLGNASHYWKDLYLKGKWKDGTNEKSLQDLINDNNALQAEIVNLRAMFEETTIEEKTLSYSYLQWEEIPSNIDGQPIVFSGGSEMTNVKGNSCVVNQLVKNGNFADGTNEWIVNTGAGSISANNNVCRLTQTTNDRPYLGQNVNFVVGQKYFIRLTVAASANVELRPREGSNNIATSIFLTAGTKTNLAFIHTSIDGSNLRFYMWDGSQNDYIDFENIQMVNLTTNSLDSLTTVDQVRSALLARGINIDEYNSYNTGSIKNSKPTALVVKHFNLWNEQYEVGGINATTGADLPVNDRIRSKNFIPVRPNTTLYFKYGAASGNIQPRYYDKNYNYLGDKDKNGSTNVSNGTRTTPDNCFYVKFATSADYGTTYNNDICINVSNATLNGTYKPYQAPNTYALDLPILRATPSDKDDSKKVNVATYVCSGDESFTYNSTNNYFNSPVLNLGAKTYSAGGRCLCSNGIIIRPLDTRFRVYLSDNPQLTDQSDMNAVFPNGTVINYPLENPTDQVAITLPDDIVIENGDSFEITYDSTDNCGADFDFAVATNKLA